MPIVHDLITRNLIVDTVCDLYNDSVLILQTAANIEVGRITLDNDAFANSIDGRAVANGFPKQTTTIYAGEIKKFILQNNSSNISGTVSIPNGGGDIELAKLDYIIGETIILNQLIYRVRQ